MIPGIYSHVIVFMGCILLIRLYIMKIDIIGHVVEKDDMRDKDVNGRTSKLIDITLEDLE